ncbi:MAG: prolyl oligopeptidase family serine peptidase [Deltaproteobacteria bacterium]|nr:prolyl oligopeptidase family serine peptidase [Deltaproteobacteria bacterium]
MPLTQRLFVKFSPETQRRIVDFVARRGWLQRIPMFRMFTEFMAIFGADPADIDAAMGETKDLGDSFVAAWRRQAESAEEKATLAENGGDKANAATLFHRTAIYYQIADWACRDDAQCAVLSGRSLAAYDRYVAARGIDVLKVDLPVDTGTVKALYRKPDGGGPFPAVVFYQGNDMTKELTVKVEDVALAHGLAILNVDQSGFGESYFTGSRMRSLADVTQCAKACVDFLQNRPEIGGERVGVFGLSFGGIVAILAAGTEPRFHALASLGAPYHLSRVIREVAHMQIERAYKWSGASTTEELFALIDGMRIEDTVAAVKVPAMVMHGDRDEIVDPDHAVDLANRLGGPVDFLLVPGGNHMCTNVLEDELIPQTLGWLAETL